MKQTILFLSLLFFQSNMYSQERDACNIWKNKEKMASAPTGDTIKIKVKYVTVVRNRNNHHDTDKKQVLYQQVNTKSNPDVDLCFQLIGCEQFIYYPFAYKPKYDYTLFHRKNKNGKYVDWPAGTLVEITCIRYNQYYTDNTRQIIMISDIRPTGETLPYVVPEYLREPR